MKQKEQPNKIRMNKLAFSISMALFLSLPFFSTVNAQTEIPDSLLSERVKTIKNTIETDHHKTQGWWYTWLATYSAATIVQGAIYFESDQKGLKQDMALGAATTLLGAAGQFISPFKPNKEFSNFSLLPENSTEEQLKKLAKAEDLLKEWSKLEREALTWQNHILCTSVNIGGGLITWIGFKRSVWDGILNFAMNTIVTEAQIWTQPKFAMRNYKKYCQKYLTEEIGYSAKPEMNWYIEARPCGLGLKVVF